MDDEILNVVKSIAVRMTEKGLRLSVAESCTGGLISTAVTDLAGASNFFDMSIVCYSLRSKRSVLGISDSLLKKHGMISEETARAMAESVLKMSGADVALSITGVAGPDRMEDKEVGLVYITVASKDFIDSFGQRLTGDRAEIRRNASLEALKFLNRILDLWL